MRQESRFYAWIFTCHMKIRTPRGPGSPNPDTLFAENLLFPPLERRPALLFCLGVFSSPSLSLSLPPHCHSVLWFNLLGNFTLRPLLPPHHHLFPHRQTIYSHPSAVRLPLTRGQVCPCVTSSNRKCIMDVTFLSISTTKSHSPPCSHR